MSASPIVPSRLPLLDPATLMLARTDLDRAAHLRGDPAGLDLLWLDTGTRCVVVGGGRALAREGRLLLVTPEQAAGYPEAERFLLGVAPDGVAHGALHLAGDEVLGLAETLRAEALTLRELGAGLDVRDAGVLVHAIALANWHETHPRCPRCGAATVVTQAGHSRHCPVDESEHFPRTDPAVIMAVVDPADRLLLGRQRVWAEGRFSTLAGFVEAGESAERAVAREVLEEVALRVTAVEYLGSQPWPFPSSLMLGYRAWVEAGDPTPDQHEIAEAAWFSRPQLREALATEAVRLPPEVSIARRLIEHWYGETLPG